MFTHILLASDGSACALKAANAAAEIARKFHSRLTVVTVLQPHPGIAPDGLSLDYGLDTQTMDEIQDDVLADTGRVLARRDVAYRGRKECGNAAESIATVAQEEGCDLIVLGSRGLGGVKAFLLGNVSDRVMHLAHCPVLIVR